MVTNDAVVLKDIHKQYALKHTTIYGGVTKHGSKTVLNGVNISIKKGEICGLIGRNGSGKSTILKILSGIIGPDSGTITINGKIASILELGMGFDPELSGRDNIYLKCQLFGLNKNKIDANMDSMIQFSELGDLIDSPLRTYSSGMAAKLAFSVLINVFSQHRFPLLRL